MVIASLTWQQVNAWRLQQQRLSPRASCGNLLEAVTHTGGVQAQVMSAAELGLSARVESLSPQDVRTALWKERTLIKTWAMRATLHLISASDLPLYAAARSLYQTRNFPYYFNYYGIPAARYEAFLAAVPQILSDQPLTREQLAAALLERTGSAELQNLIQIKGWGTPLKPSAWRGELCFGPNQGRNVTTSIPAIGLAGGSLWSHTRRCKKLPAATCALMARRCRMTSPAGGN